MKTPLLKSRDSLEVLLTKRMAIPVMFVYHEQSLNANNRAAAVARQGADDLNSRVWWDVTPN